MLVSAGAVQIIHRLSGEFGKPVLLVKLVSKA